MTGQHMALVGGVQVPWLRCCGRPLSDEHREGCRMVVRGRGDLEQLCAQLDEKSAVCAGCGYHVCSCQAPSDYPRPLLPTQRPEWPTPEPPTFKPGDRVRCVRAEPVQRIKTGETYEVRDVTAGGVRLVDCFGPWACDRFVHADAQMSYAPAPHLKWEDVQRVLNEMAPGTIERIEPEGADREGWEEGRRYFFMSAHPKTTFCARKDDRWSWGAPSCTELQFSPTLLEAQKAVERAVREAEQPEQADHEHADEPAKPFALGVSPKMLARLMRKRYGAHTPCGGSSFMQHDWGFDYESSTCKRCGAHWRDVE